MGDREDSKGTRVYVGGLTNSVKKEDLENEFEKFGKLNSVWVAFNPPGFAFIEFSSHEDAETACGNLNGSDFFGSKLRVEIARGIGRRGGFRGGHGGGGGGGRRGSGPRNGSFRSYGSSDRGNGYRGSRGGSSSRGPGGGSVRGGRFDDYGRDDRYGGSRDYRNGDGFRSGARDKFSRGGRGGSGRGGQRFDSNPRFRSRSPIGGPRR